MSAKQMWVKCKSCGKHFLISWATNREPVVAKRNCPHCGAVCKLYTQTGTVKFIKEDKKPSSSREVTRKILETRSIEEQSSEQKASDIVQYLWSHIGTSDFEGDSTTREIVSLIQICGSQWDITKQGIWDVNVTMISWGNVRDYLVKELDYNILNQAYQLLPGKKVKQPIAEPEVIMTTWYCLRDVAGVEKDSYWAFFQVHKETKEFSVGDSLKALNLFVKSYFQGVEYSFDKSEEDSIILLEDGAGVLLSEGTICVVGKTEHTRDTIWRTILDKCEDREEQD